MRLQVLQITVPALFTLHDYILMRMEQLESLPFFFLLTLILFHFLSLFFLSSFIPAPFPSSSAHTANQPLPFFFSGTDPPSPCLVPRGCPARHKPRLQPHPPTLPLLHSLASTTTTTTTNIHIHSHSPPSRPCCGAKSCTNLHSAVRAGAPGVLSSTLSFPLSRSSCAPVRDSRLSVRLLFAAFFHFVACRFSFCSVCSSPNVVSSSFPFFFLHPPGA